MKEVEQAIINKDYIDYTGTKYPGLKELSFKRDESIKCLGRIVKSNHKENYDGIYIVRNNENPNIAYKIDEASINYQAFDNFKTCSFAFAPEFIAELQQRQPLIKRTDFPTGIVTIDHYCIGEEIVYYDGITLKEFTKLPKNKFILPTNLYLNLLESLKELADNSIYYCDLHNKNFVVYKDKETNTETIKIIDFAQDYVKFELSKGILQVQKQNLEMSMNKSMKNLSIPETITLNAENPIEDAMEKVMKLGQRYR